MIQEYQKITQEDEENQEIINKAKKSNAQRYFIDQEVSVYTLATGIGKTIIVSLTQSQIKINSKSQNVQEKKVMPLADVIGFNQEYLSAHVVKFTLNSYQRKKKWFKSLQRYVYSQTFYIKTNQEGFNYAGFKQNLIMAITNRPLQRLNKLKLMIYFNPNAGANSKKHLQATIKFLKLTNFQFDVLTTERQNHCLQHLNQLAYKQYEGVVIISGDGLMHQFANSQACTKIPVTHVPGGSGNAFSKTQTMLAGQLCKDQQAIFLAVKGRTKQMNIIKYELQKIERPIYSFLSFQWCIMADIDVNSQFLRFLGGFRFQLYTAWRILFLRRYKGKFTYSKTKAELPPLNEPIDDNQDFVHEQNTYLHQLITSIPYISDKYEFSPLLKVEDRALDMQVITERQGRWQLLKYLLNSQNGGHFDKAQHKQKDGFNFNWAHIKSFRLQPNGQDFGVFGIDGQRYEAQKIQASVSDKKMITFV